VSPNEASSKFQNEMLNFSPKGMQSGRQGWGPGTNSRDPIESPRNMMEDENDPWNSSRAVGNNDVPLGFQLNRTVERFNPGELILHIYEPFIVINKTPTTPHQAHVSVTMDGLRNSLF
jgi:hypothetical protein